MKLPKKGDMQECQNYRGIMLLSVPGKVLKAVILDRLKTGEDAKLSDHQTDFRKGRSCTDQIATLRIIVEQSMEWDSSGRVDKTDPVKMALLLRTIGKHGNDIYESFTWEADADKDKYDKVVENFDKSCAPRVNVVALTHKLLTMKQGQTTVDEYVTALHNVARDCSLGSKEQYDRMMIQTLLLGVESIRVRRHLFERQQFSLDEAVATCRAMEAVRDDVKKLFENQTETVHSIKPASRRYASNKYKSITGMKPSAENCSKCGEQHPPRRCKAYGKECFKCKKINHFAKCCNSKTVSVRTE